MRGKLRWGQVTDDTARIIPAHAGQTTETGACTRLAPDHPRACGANKHGVSHMKQECGSSPRMRGKREHRRRDQQVQRIIPAHAGQTRGPRMECRRGPDHPRACGANGIWRKPGDVQYGSSPRMRGKPCFFGCLPVMLRIIPAHAGQTPQLTAPTR